MELEGRSSVGVVEVTGEGEERKLVPRVYCSRTLWNRSQVPATPLLSLSSYELFRESKEEVGL